jgi:hypothetical protein
MPALFSGGLGLVTILCLGDRHLSASILSPIAVAGCLWGEGGGKAFACPRNLESHMRLLESMNASFPPCGFLDLLLFMLVDES